MKIYHIFTLTVNIKNHWNIRSYWGSWLTFQSCRRPYQFPKSLACLGSKPVSRRHISRRKHHYWIYCTFEVLKIWFPRQITNLIKPIHMNFHEFIWIHMRKPNAVKGRCRNLSWYSHDSYIYICIYSFLFFQMIIVCRFCMFCMFVCLSIRLFICLFVCLFVLIEWKAWNGPYVHSLSCLYLFSFIWIYF